MLIQDSPLLPNDTSGLENRTVVVTTIMVGGPGTLTWASCQAPPPTLTHELCRLDCP